MIRADLYKGAKRLSNFIDRDASPRKDDQGKSHFSMHFALSRDSLQSLPEGSSLCCVILANWVSPVRWSRNV